TPEAIGSVAIREFFKSKIQSEIAADESALETLKADFADYNELSEIGQNVFDARAGIESLDNIIRHKEFQETREPSPALTESIVALKSRKQVLENILGQIDIVSENRTQEQKNNDDDIIGSINKGNEYSAV